MSEQPATLPPQVLKNLGDRSYEKRKQAALEIERIIKDLNSRDELANEQSKIKEPVKQIIRLLVDEYTYSQSSNYRKGGLIGLAAASIALMDETNHYLTTLLPPVLKCFTDSEARVRYYACEALYNITKVARGHILLFFNEIFDNLCRVYSDPDVDVTNGAQLLDRLLKDVVTECETFNVDKFIPLLRERIRNSNPFVRQLLVGWIAVLDSVPDIDMLEFLPEYLGGLFDMLSDDEKDIRQQAYQALSDLLREISTSPHVGLGSMVGILVKQCESNHTFTRITVLQWLKKFIQLGQRKLLALVPDMLGTALMCISDKEVDIQTHALQLNKSLLKLVEQSDTPIDIDPLLKKVTAHLIHQWDPSRLPSLQWISMLLTKAPGEIFSHLQELFPALLKTLQDTDDLVVLKDLEVLARISLDKDKQLDQNNFSMVLSKLMGVMLSDRSFLEKRGSLVIRQLSTLLDGTAIYITMAQLLASTDDLHFSSLMVQTLDLILLTSSELFDLRTQLKHSAETEEGRKLFVTLYNAWCHNAVSTFSLCLLSQSYELASALILQIAEIEPTVGFLMQIDKLVQLIESPIFIHLRLQLLEPKRYPFLFKSLYGLLMLLPQSSAFTSLHLRLESVAPIGLLSLPDSEYARNFTADYRNKPKTIAWPPPAEPEAAKKQNEAPAKTAPAGSSTLDVKTLLKHFHDTQEKHRKMHQQAARQESLISKPDVATTATTAAPNAAAPK